MAHVIGTPWAGGPVRTQPTASELANVRTFSAKGISASGVLGTSPLPQIGTLIPGTPYVYVRPRLSQDDLGGSAGSTYVPFRFPGAPSFLGGAQAASAVHRTNPAFAFYRQNIRTPSIGMGGALSSGATFDVPYSNEDDIPYFSVA